MRHKIIIGMLWLFILTACQEQKIIEPLMIRGDIEQWLTVEDTTEPINPIELIESLVPLYSDYDLVISSRDGFSVKITGTSLENTNIAYTPTTGWTFVSDKHPVNSGVKWISDVVVVKKESLDPMYTAGLNIIVDRQNYHYSLGELLSMDYGVRYQLDGTTEQMGNTIDVMKQMRYFNLEDLIDVEYQWLLVMDNDGEHHYLPAGDYQLELTLQRLDLVDEQLQRIKGVVGIMLNPPGYSVMDNYYDAMNYLEKDVPVMTIFLDGFSYEQWLYMGENKSDLFLSKLNFNEATSVYKPVTNAGFASMISGQTPYVTGIMDRSVRRLACGTIFDKVDGVLIDGLVKILDIPCELYLENDLNEDGYTDSEVYEQSLEALAYDYVLVHFNGIDDAGHNYGPYGEATIQKIVEVDRYVEALVATWHGKVIIVADHGMHQTADGGSHGEFRAEDLLIPYLLINGGQYEKSN